MSLSGEEFHTFKVLAFMARFNIGSVVLLWLWEGSFKKNTGEHCEFIVVHSPLWLKLHSVISFPAETKQVPLPQHS